MSSKFSLKAYIIATLVGGVITLVLLLVIPGDVDASFLIGHSRERVVMLAFVLAPLGLLGWMIFMSWRRPIWMDNLSIKVKRLLEDEGVLMTVLFFGI